MSLAPKGFSTFKRYSAVASPSVLKSVAIIISLNLSFLRELAEGEGPLPQGLWRFLHGLCGQMSDWGRRFVALSLDNMSKPSMNVK